MYFSKKSEYEKKLEEAKALLVGTGISMKLAYDGMTQKQVSDVYKYDIRVDLGDKVTDEQKTELTVMRINGFSIKQTRGYLA